MTPTSAEHRSALPAASRLSPQRPRTSSTLVSCARTLTAMPSETPSSPRRVQTARAGAVSAQRPGHARPIRRSAHPAKDGVTVPNGAQPATETRVDTRSIRSRRIRTPHRRSARPPERQPGQFVDGVGSLDNSVDESTELLRPVPVQQVYSRSSANISRSRNGRRG
jgi:hypothetical protein